MRGASVRDGEADDVLIPVTGLAVDRHAGAPEEAAEPHRDGRDDLALVRAYRAGDGAAFDEICARYDGRVRGLCWHYLRHGDMVDDMVQETFCHLLEALGRVDDSFNLSGWIHRIATNLCLDELRRRSRRRQTDVPPDDDAADVTVVQLADDDRMGQPEEALEVALTRDLVRAAVSQVPPRQRNVLLLRDVAEMSHERIATTLDLPRGAVQGLLHRARERFKERYLALEGMQPVAGECAKVGYVLEHLSGRTTRRDRLRSVRRHVAGCGRCRARFGASPLAREEGLGTAS